MQYVTGFQQDDRLRGMFNQLTDLVFRLNLEGWYRAGFWTDRYVPHAMLDGDRMIANVSVNRMELKVDGRRARGLQVGTVMSHPEFRGQGHAKRLMQQVIEQYRDECDFVYLLSNAESSGFYPRFGFHPVAETQFACVVTSITCPDLKLEQLPVGDPETRRWIHDVVGRRVAVSEVFGVLGGAELFMYHALNRFPDSLWRVQGADVIVIARIVGRALHLYDIVTADERDPTSLAGAFMRAGVERVIAHFTPDRVKLPWQEFAWHRSDAMFVLSEDRIPGHHFRRPATSEA